MTWDSAGMLPSTLPETGSHLAELPYPLLAAEETSWFDIPGVQIVGAILGTVLLVAALRSMFGGRR
ncbi:hypothetical protein [Plantactinospora endophytica]|uniref:Uncharacterized protein n=1 Tax=Plantactinospora endophytica TaxID=673535 RepID=A0ABQ4ECZ3_9ACTN|nr:hypothetical protein [Plantactinospora endophytica]GIG92592.1 hypothetical protein Pen02_75280 [Plantactinospora endophytica]